MLDGFAPSLSANADTDTRQPYANAGPVHDRRRVIRANHNIMSHMASHKHSRGAINTPNGPSSSDDSHGYSALERRLI